MRKLHQLLPIVREHLTTVDQEEIYGEFDTFTCVAANFARLFEKITEEEQFALKHAIHTQLGYGRCSTIYAALGCPTPDVTDVEFIPMRDAWLDEFQRKLEREDR